MGKESPSATVSILPNHVSRRGHAGTSIIEIAAAILGIVSSRLRKFGFTQG